MMVTIANRQRVKSINSHQLKRITAALLAELEIAEAELGLSLVAASEMTRINETFLQHPSSTDVITFDYSFGVPPSSNPGRVNAELQTLHGEIFICVDEAVSQARKFKTTWQSEIVRYLIHGVLHLLGHDDHRAAARRKMKREENRLLRRLAKEFPLARLAR